MNPNCKAEFHQYYPTFGSSGGYGILVCILKENHERSVHKFESGNTSIIDNRESCSCPRCKKYVKTEQNPPKTEVTKISKKENTLSKSYKTTNGEKYHYCVICKTKDFDLFNWCPTCSQRQRTHARHHQSKKVLPRI